MTKTDYFLLVGFIYLAPHTPKGFAHVMACLHIAYGLYLMFNQA